MDEFPAEVIDTAFDDIIRDLREKDPCRTCTINCRETTRKDIPCDPKNKWWDHVRRKLLNGH